MASHVGKHTESYNARLFKPGSLRRAVHMARFDWVGRQLRDMPQRGYSMVEVGCFDGRVLRHCPPPERYFGIDANWEGGLDEALINFADEAGWTFEAASSPEALARHADRSFDVGLSLETMEHIDPALVEPYVRELARLCTGRVLITVPNEKGLVFVLKRLAKKLMGHALQPYTTREWFDTVRGDTSGVVRDGHKGFDYMWLADVLSRHFRVERVAGISARGVPRWASLTIGIVAVPKA